MKTASSLVYYPKNQMHKIIPCDIIMCFHSHMNGYNVWKVSRNRGRICGITSEHIVESESIPSIWHSPTHDPCLLKVLLECEVF